MKNERLKKYLPLFISVFMLVSFLGLITLGSFLLLTTSSRIDNSYDYYKWNEWGLTIFALKVLGVIALFVGWGAWFGLAILVERKLKIQIFRRGLDYYNLVRARPNFLKVIVQKSPSSTDETKGKS